MAEYWNGANVNRRGFLGLLAGAAVAPLVPVPELDLGRRIFLPPRGGWVARGGNRLLTITEIVRESQRILHAEMQFVVPLNRQYDEGFATRSQWPDTTVRVQLPRRYA